VTLGGRVSDIVTDVGLEVSSAGSARDAEQFLLDSLQARRDQVSGVNTDEEMVLLIEHEQAFQAAAQYIRVLSELNAELMNLL
jgi:flagellar hook-associated protein FlgK